jgi:hypothetical protein
MKVLHDGPAEVPIRINHGRHKGVARVQMRKGGTRCPHLPGDSVSRHWEERGVTRQRKGRSRVQGRIAMGRERHRKAQREGPGAS